MSQGVTLAQKPRTVLTARRLALMASVAVLGAGVLFSGAEYATKPNSFLAAPAYAQSTQRPVGFAVAQQRQNQQAGWQRPDALILITTRNLVLFPGVILPVAIKLEKTVAGAQQAVRQGRQTESGAEGDGQAVDRHYVVERDGAERAGADHQE